MLNKEEITLDDIDNNIGIFVKRTKGSLSEWTIWTPRLRRTIDKAMVMRHTIISKLKKMGKPVPTTRNLLITRFGLPYTKSANNSAWSRAYAKLVAIGAASYDKDKSFTFHDIKAKGVSDHARNESGHKSEKAKSVYMRKVKEVGATR